jgi:hypothetical protein
MITGFLSYQFQSVRICPNPKTCVWQRRRRMKKKGKKKKKKKNKNKEEESMLASSKTLHSSLLCVCLVAYLCFIWPFSHSIHTKQFIQFSSILSFFEFVCTLTTVTDWIVNGLFLMFFSTRAGVISRLKVI